MMNAWVFRRRLIVALVVTGVAFLLGLGVWFGLLRPEPTEPLPEFEDPRVLWSRAIETDRGIYNALAYVSTVGLNAYAPQSRYRFDFFAADGRLLSSQTYHGSIPSEQLFRVFAPRVALPVRPELVTLTFESSNWQRGEQPLPELTARNVTLSGAQTTPRAKAEVVNQEFFAVDEIEVVAEVLEPESGDLLGISRNLIDRLTPEAVQAVTFTWPNPFPVDRAAERDILTESGELDVILILDRSGSMAGESWPIRGFEPPLQPMHDVLLAADRFVDRVREGDQLAVISFATEATDPPDADLSADRQTVKEAVAAIEPILAERQAQVTQFTNTGDAFRVAREELLRGGRDEAHSVIIYLTDGEAPNRPLREGDEDYPTVYALEQVDRLEAMGAEIYTIGLGKQFDDSFLLEVATTPEHHSNAPGAEFLDEIYEKIADQIQTTPLEVRVTPRGLRLE